jgi:CheY-like chemotaxis protein
MSADPCTVLVIDRAEHARWVEPGGYETFEAASTLEALGALAERPDVTLLFSDVLLSRLSGADLAAYLAAQPGKVVVLHGATAGIARVDAAGEARPGRRWWEALRRMLRALLRLTGSARRPRRRMRPGPLAAGS